MSIYFYMIDRYREDGTSTCAWAHGKFTTAA